MENLITVSVIILAITTPFSLCYAIKTAKGYAKMNKELDELIEKYSK